MNGRWVARVAGLVALVLALAGCSPAQETLEKLPVLTEADSPLQRYLTVWDTYSLGPNATRAEIHEAATEQARQTEELVAQCMAMQGFDYLPNLGWLEHLQALTSEEYLPRPDDRDWVARWGYGLAASPDQLAPEKTTPPVDPNQEYIDSLTPDEQRAYDHALYGPANDDPEWTWETGGCQGWASHEIGGDGPAQADENQPILDAVSAFLEKPLAGPELEELNADWAACLSTAGFGPFGKPEEAQSSVHRQVNEHWRTQDDPDGDRIARIDEDPAYAAIASHEIALALADLDCREQTDYAQRLIRIRFAAEEQFIADHQEELDALVARVAQARK